jgi:hypothetical protein
MSEEQDRIEEKLNRLEKEIPSIVEQRLDDAIKKAKVKPKSDRGHVFWGLFLIAIGILWLAEKLDWIHFDFAWLWPTALICFGLYLMFGGKRR